ILNRNDWSKPLPDQTHADPTLSVSRVIIDRDRRTIRLAKTATEWRDAFHTMDVSFSRRHASRLARRQHDIFKRKDPKAAQAHNALVFPAAPPSTGNLTTNSRGDINFQALDQVVFPPPVIDDALKG